MKDQFAEVLGHAHATLLDIAESPGKKPTASKKAVARLRRANSKQSNRDAAPGSDAEQILGREWTWEDLESATTSCCKCPHLVKTRTQVVFGVGNRNADLMFVGEAPGAEEDLQGEPFVGKAGALLTKILGAMELSREKIYIANILKCRPDMPPGESGNRKPKPDEMATCLPWLTAQIRLVQPKVLIALGATAAEGLLGETSAMKDLRGRWFDYASIPTLVTYHPAYLLRNQSMSEKRKVWEDMLQAMERMELPISEKQRGYFLAAENKAS